jgi:carbonic anhydrase/acetyltransferase-like protein (isoleucine patch superfamily)
MKNTLPIIIVMILWLGSASAGLAPYFLYGMDVNSKLIKFATLLSFFPLFILSFSLLAGLLSRPAQKGVVAGVFPRQPLHPVYFLRRIYGGCWTQLFYFRPLYSIVLFIPAYKSLILRLFGYKGKSTNFTMYPDTWIRDLPVLNFDENVYLSNRATIGSNLCLSDGNILVDKIQIGRNSLIGHMAIIGPSIIGENTEVGVGAAMGIRVKLGNNVRVLPRAGVGHGVKIGDNTTIGQMSHIGTKVTIGPGLDIPAGANIPNGSVLLTQEDVANYISSETELLSQIRETLKSSLSSEIQDVS